MKYFVLLCLLISGCATSEKYNAQISTWLGRDVNTLIQAWGPPTSEFTAPNGNKIYTYKRSNGVLSNAEYNPYDRSASSTTQELSCVTSFTVNSVGLISAYRFQGNTCKAE